MSRSAKVLIIEDSTFLTQIMLRQLLSMDHITKIAETGAAALEILRDWLPEIVICDLFLPDMKGEEIIERVRRDYPTVRVVVFSTTPRDQVEELLQKYAIRDYLQKPLSKERLLQLVQTLSEEHWANQGKSAVVLPSPADQPWETHVKSCYVCGFDEVNVFVPKHNSYDEDWNEGLFPTFSSNGGFRPWDHLKTAFTVCPLCLFTSHHLSDWAEKNHHHDYPYRGEARKILATGITGRKKLIGLRGDEKDCFAFDTPMRTQLQVHQTILLAQRSASALILGDKAGAHADLGYLYLLDQALGERPNVDLLRDALGNFMNQLKSSMNSRVLISKCYYFAIAIHFALGESLKANALKDRLEQYYLTVDPSEASDEECMWNERLVHIWNIGVNHKTRRFVD